MMKHNLKDLSQPLNIITTDNRTFNNMDSGVISGSSINIPVDKKDNSNTHDNISIGTYNIQGNINGKIDHILYVMDERNIDILFLQETNSKKRRNETSLKTYYTENILSPNQIDKYFIIHNADHEQNTAAGTAFIVHASLFKHIQNITSFPGPSLTISLGFKKELYSRNTNYLHLTGIYFPPKGNDLPKYKNKIAEITSHVNDHIKKFHNTHHILLGDFNLKYNTFKELK